MTNLYSASLRSSRSLHSSSSPKVFLTTELIPFGSDSSYESFVVGKKGSCRKCGCTARNKRRCERCYRKFCSTCAPYSLQKYGEQLWEECCIGCEPYLVVAPASSEPILELEPESEEVALLSTICRSTRTGMTTACTCRNRIRPLHVPLSATIAPLESSNTTSLPTAACTCTPSKSDNNTDDDDDDDDNHNKVSSPGSSTTVSMTDSSADTGTINSQLDNSHHGEDGDDDDEHDGQQHQQQHHHESFAAMTGLYSSLVNNTAAVVTTTATTTNTLFWKGCCASCHHYATGKRPCLGCGAKYCQEECCRAQLYSDGTCVSCSDNRNNNNHQSTHIDETILGDADGPAIENHEQVLQQKLEMGEAPRTPSRSTAIRRTTTTVGGVLVSADNNGAVDLDSIECPLTPQAGCCTVCQQYAIAKRPCPSCGSQYCHDDNCSHYIFQDGTCVKCRAVAPPNQA